MNRIAYKEVNGTSYHEQTNDQVVRVLERVRRQQYRIRVHYGDVETGKDWNDQYDVTGTVGRSTGPIKVPLLIHNAMSHGGGSILDHCIVRIRYSNKQKGRFDLYTHPKYHSEATE